MCIIPLTPLTKIPSIEWKEYQNKRPTSKEIVEWFGGKVKPNIAIICGTISGNLVVVDFDREDLYIKFKEKLIKESIDLYNKFLQTWIVKTRKGYHVYFRIDISPEEFKRKVKTEHGGGETIDIQAEGAYVVAPPSIVRDEEKKEFIYFFLDGFSPDDEPTKLTWEEWEKIHKIVKDLLAEIRTEEKNTPQTVTEQTKQTGQQKKESAIVYSGKMKVLGDSEIIEIKELFKDSWKPGNRHDLALFLSGWFAKSNIHPVSVAKAFMALTEENQDLEPEDRLSTIYYTYSKAFGDIDELKELDKFVEDLKAKGKIKRKVSKRDSEETEAIKGKSGVQEILEKTVGEERALEIIRRLEEILGTASPYNDSITIITDFDRGLGYTNNTKHLRIYRSRRESDKEGKDGKIKLDKLVWEGAITKLTVYINPFGGSTKYEIVWVSEVRQRKPITIGPATLDEIYHLLKNEGFLSNSRLGNDALNNIINAFIRRNKAEIRTDIDSPGFYVIENRIRVEKYEIADVKIEELREALELLNELAEKWYGNTKERFSTIIKWGIISPFIFAKKQLGRQFQVPHLALYGSRNTGKSTLAEIISIHLWGIDRSRVVFAGTQVNTEARLGDKISKSTFPIVVNEANAVFVRPEVINMLKNSVEDITARGRFSSTGYVNIPALSPIIFTLNPTPRVEFEEMELAFKTILLINFSEGERLSPERIAEFRKDIEPRLPKLKAIGQYVAKLMLSKGVEELKKDWKDLAKELLQQTYRDAGLTPPEWIGLDYEVKGFEDIDIERREIIRNKLLKYINEQYSRLIGKIIDMREDGSTYTVEETLQEKLSALLRQNGIPFMIQKGEMIYITSGILRELGLEFESLKSLAELLKWRYVPKKHMRDGEKEMNMSVIEIQKSELIRFLVPEIGDEEES